MKTYETFATVDETGQIHLAGVPFAAGTEVEVQVRPKSTNGSESTQPDQSARAAARERMRELFSTIKGFRNSPRITREDLYDRGRLP